MIEALQQQIVQLEKKIAQEHQQLVDYQQLLELQENQQFDKKISDLQSEVDFYKEQAADGERTNEKQNLLITTLHEQLENL